MYNKNKQMEANTVVIFEGEKGRWSQTIDNWVVKGAFRMGWYSVRFYAAVDKETGITSNQHRVPKKIFVGSQSFTEHMLWARHCIRHRAYIQRVADFRYHGTAIPKQPLNRYSKSCPPDLKKTYPRAGY